MPASEVKSKKRRRRSTKGSNSSPTVPNPPDADMPSTPTPVHVPPATQPLPHTTDAASCSTTPGMYNLPRIQDYPHVYMPAHSSYASDVNAKLDFILTKLSKLDAIESQQSTILNRLTAIEAKIYDNKGRIDDAHVKISSIEDSQKFLSDNYDKVVATSDTNAGELATVKQDLNLMTERNAQLVKDQEILQDDIIDLKCRSMRDNLIFLGITESNQLVQVPDRPTVSMETSNNGTYAAAAASQSTSTAASTTGNEDCSAKIYSFCESVLKIENPRAKIRIDRAHRIGSASSGRIRPIVVKFMDTDSKVCVKEATKGVRLRDLGYGVHDQLPHEVQERRKALIPVMVKARADGKRAYMVRDKLFINNREYKPDSN